MRESTATIQENSWRYEGWRVALAALLALTIGPSTVLLSFGIFVRPISIEFGWTIAQVTMAVTIMSFALVVIAPLQGYLVDRFGARKVILPSILLFAVAMALMSKLAADFWLYCVAWVAVAVAGLGIYPLSYLRAVGTWFDRRLGLGLGIANAGIGVGGALLPLILGAVIPMYGWRWGFVSIAIMALIAFPVAFLFVRERASSAIAGARPGVSTGVAFRDAVRTREFRLLAAIFVLMGFVTTALIVHQIPILIELGITPERAAIVQFTFGLFAIAGRVLTGLLIDFISAQLLMMGVVLGAAVACLLYAAGVSQDIAFVSAALIGLLLGAEFDVLGFLLKKYFGIRSFGRLYGIVYAAFQLSAGIGAAVLSLMQQSYGAYTNGLMLFSAILFVCACLLFWLYRLGQPVAAQDTDGSDRMMETRVNENG